MDPIGHYKVQGSDIMVMMDLMKLLLALRVITLQQLTQIGFNDLEGSFVKKRSSYFRCTLE